MLKCLWITAELPFPAEGAERQYRARMAAALCAAGFDVCMIGHAADMAPPADWPVRCVPVPGGLRTRLNPLATLHPLETARYDTPAFEAALSEALARRWDVMIIDGAAAGFAFEACRAARREQGGAIIYLIQQNVGAAARQLARSSRGPLRRKLALWQDAWKTGALEHRLANGADLITTTSPADGARHAALCGRKSLVVLTPGYAGPVTAQRHIDEATPRRVLLAGSFQWVVKQEALRRFIELADERFAARGIVLDVAGDMPLELREQLERSTRSACFHGFVEDLGPLRSQARLAVIPGLGGPGARPRFLEYIFGRVPVACLTDAGTVLSRGLRRHMICRDELGELVDAVIAAVDEPQHLQALQQAAFSEASAEYDWNERGVWLRSAIEHLLAGARLPAEPAAAS